ncbi:thermonuclease family protein [Roseibium sp. SCP14]|uniref:thermonuclease family protein n=1 Tax=Roseibium sp. SCP14 TaxID=3141375 RepID=UPI00333D1952
MTVFVRTTLFLLAASLTTMLTPDASAASVNVVDGDTIDIDGQRLRLYGIDAPEAGQSCKNPGGGTWPCGRRAIEALEKLVGSGNVNCNNLGTDGYGRTLSICSTGSVDINEAMVRQGHAWSFRLYSDDYNDAEDAARSERAGIWQTETQTPWDYRANRWAAAEQKAPEGCPIKGNISRNGRIYHAPWSPWYSRTKINTSNGERWFCNEAEAIKAGWRAPLWGNR